MNVDGLHQLAGSNPDSVFEVHGTVRRFCCCKCRSPIIIPDPLLVKDNPPLCSCGGYPRPDVTLFTEALPQEPWENAVDAVSLLRQEDVMIIVGTSSVVYPAASLPEMAKRRGCTLIEINPDDVTPLKQLVCATPRPI